VYSEPDPEKAETTPLDTEIEPVPNPVTASENVATRAFVAEFPGVAEEDDTVTVGWI